MCWRKCYTVYRSTSTRVNGGATLVGVASLARESDDMVAAKCKCSICGFSQYSVVLGHGLHHGFVGQRVYGVYARALANIKARCVVIIHEH